LKWGLAGAAIATAVNQFIGGLIPILYFMRKNDSLLRLGKARFDGKVFLKVCTNGMSELITNIALSVIAILYNAQLMDLVGIAGVSAYGVMQYIGFIFVAVFLGYAVGSAPIIGYHFGAQNTDELKNVFKDGKEVLTKYSVSENGVDIKVTGEGKIAYMLPAFEFDGRTQTEIKSEGNKLEVTYKGWKCEYTSSAPIKSLDKKGCNRNGHYKAYYTGCANKLDLKIEITKVENNV
jgi:hypothetical protein